jgi:hypothetical protein
VNNWLLIGLLVVLFGALLFLQHYNLKALERAGVDVPKSVRNIRWINVALLLGILAYALWATLKG